MDLFVRVLYLSFRICELQSSIESIQTQFTQTKDDLNSQERLHQRAEAGKSLLEAQYVELKKYCKVGNICRFYFRYIHDC